MFSHLQGLSSTAFGPFQTNSRSVPWTAGFIPPFHAAVPVLQGKLITLPECRYPQKMEAFQPGIATYSPYAPLSFQESVEMLEKEGIPLISQVRDKEIDPKRAMRLLKNQNFALDVAFLFLFQGEIYLVIDTCQGSLCGKVCFFSYHDAPYFSFEGVYQTHPQELNKLRSLTLLSEKNFEGGALVPCTLDELKGEKLADFEEQLGQPLTLAKNVNEALEELMRRSGKGCMLSRFETPDQLAICDSEGWVWNLTLLYDSQNREFYLIDSKSESHFLLSDSSLFKGKLILPTSHLGQLGRAVLGALLAPRRMLTTLFSIPDAIKELQKKGYFLLDSVCDQPVDVNRALRLFETHSFPEGSYCFFTHSILGLAQEKIYLVQQTPLGPLVDRIQLVADNQQVLYVEKKSGIVPLTLFPRGEQVNNEHFEKGLFEPLTRETVDQHLSGIQDQLGTPFSVLHLENSVEAIEVLNKYPSDTLLFCTLQKESDALFIYKKEEKGISRTNALIVFDQKHQEYYFCTGKELKMTLVEQYKDLWMFRLIDDPSKKQLSFEEACSLAEKSELRIVPFVRHLSWNFSMLTREEKMFPEKSFFIYCERDKTILAMKTKEGEVKTHTIDLYSDSEDRIHLYFSATRQMQPLAEWMEHCHPIDATLVSQIESANGGEDEDLYAN